MFEWPSEVPYCSEAEGISANSSYSPPLVSQTEGGPPIMRPRPGPRSTELAWRSVPWTEEQSAAFEAFARRALRNGVLPFGMPVFKPGAGFARRTCQLKNGVYTTDFSQVPWIRVSFTLIVFNW